MTTTPDDYLQSPLNFDDFANLLAPLGTLNSPSELHGLLSGNYGDGVGFHCSRKSLPIASKNAVIQR